MFKGSPKRLKSKSQKSSIKKDSSMKTREPSSESIGVPKQKQAVKDPSEDLKLLRHQHSNFLVQHMSTGKRQREGFDPSLSLSILLEYSQLEYSQAEGQCRTNQIVDFSKKQTKKERHSNLFHKKIACRMKFLKVSKKEPWLTSKIAPSKILPEQYLKKFKYSIKKKLSFQLLLTVHTLALVKEPQFHLKQLIILQLQNRGKQNQNLLQLSSYSQAQRERSNIEVVKKLKYKEQEEYKQNSDTLFFINLITSYQITIVSRKLIQCCHAYQENFTYFIPNDFFLRMEIMQNIEQIFDKNLIY